MKGKKLTSRVNRRGVFFTLAILLLLIPLVLLLSFYVMSNQTKVTDTTSKIRCDEMHYFVEDVKKDLTRAGTIFGRRAAIYAIDYVIRPPGNPLINYTFNCTSLCGVDCNRIIYPVNGSEAAIAELALCGTLNGTNVTYMVNHTIREWVKKIETRGLDKKFTINLTLNEIEVVPIDAWNFSIILDNEIHITDRTDTCYFLGDSVESDSNTSIIGLEDPMYTLESQGRIMKYIHFCDPGLVSNTSVGAGSEGSGDFGGRVIIDDASIGDPGTFCSENDVSNMVLVMDDGYGSCNLFEEELCFNASTPAQDHFAGVINYGKNSLESFVIKCGITIPWIRDTGDLGLSSDDCIYVVANEIFLGKCYEELNLTCYQVSNISEYNNSCPVDYPNGPSFFDRLDGAHNLSERYVNQSLERYNNNQIGMETIIDLYDLLDHTITPYWNATQIDYLYWRNISGCTVEEVCTTAIPALRIDCPHEDKYNVSLSC